MVDKAKSYRTGLQEDLMRDLTAYADHLNLDKSSIKKSATKLIKGFDRLILEIYAAKEIKDSKKKESKK